MKINRTFKRRGEPTAAAAQNQSAGSYAQKPPAGFTEHTFDLVVDDPVVNYPPRKLTGAFDSREGAVQMLFQPGTLRLDAYVPKAISVAAIQSYSHRFGIPLPLVVALHGAATNRSCDVQFLDMVRRHTTGGCGSETCTGCCNAYHPTNSQATIHRALQYLDPVVTDFDMSGGKGELLFRFTTAPDKSQTLVTTVFKDDSFRAKLEQAVALLGTFGLDVAPEEGGES